MINKIDSLDDFIIISLSDDVSQKTLTKLNYEFKSFLNYPFSLEKNTFTIEAKLNDDEFSLLYKEICEILDAYDIILDNSLSIDGKIKDAVLEENNFLEFSRVALDIWSGNIDPFELKDFASNLAKSFPQRRLYDMQLLAAKHLAFSQNACNFSVPGTGKTTCVYAAFAHLNKQPVDSNKYINKIFVIGPKSCFQPWIEEYFECFNERLNFHKIGNSDKDDFLQITEPNSKTLLYLINFQKLTHNKYYNLCENILSRKDSNFMLVIDEAHKIKNSEGVWANKIIELSKFAKSRVILTGTPMPQGFYDLFTLFKFIYPTKNVVPYSISELKRMTKNSLTMKSQINRLNQSILPFFIRIRKSHLKDLIAPIENQPFKIELTPTELQIYKLVDQGVLNKTNKRSCYIRLLQASSNPLLLKEAINKFDFESIEFNDLEDLTDVAEINNEDLLLDENINLRYLLDTYLRSSCVHSKMEEAIKLAKELINKGEKVIIWAIFSKTIEMLFENLSKLGFDGGVLVGEGNPINHINNGLNREEVIQKFKNDSNFQFVIANAAAVGESISLHKACHNAIYYEMSYDAAQLIQSKDRIHRVGVPKNTQTNYYYFLSDNTIEIRIFRILNRKVNIMNEVIEGDEIPMLNIFNNDDTLNEIFQDYILEH
jgi:SNF2 family DNA or RNA helicase